MTAISRAAREPNCQKGHPGSYQVETGVGRLGKDPQATGKKTDSDFERREGNGGDERIQSGGTFFAALRWTDRIRHLEVKLSQSPSMTEYRSFHIQKTASGCIMLFEGPVDSRSERERSVGPSVPHEGMPFHSRNGS